mgnify:FL=1
MNIKNFKINYKDDRGIIKDLIQKKNINAITYITINKNKVRGNHYHKKTIQWNYILSGKLKVFTKQKKKRLKVKIFEKGSFFHSPPKEMHAFLALKKTEILVFTQGPRGGKEYESDTYRIKSIIK